MLSDSVQALVERDECKWMLLFLTGTVYLGVLTAIIVLYTLFPLSRDCSNGVIIITVTFLLVVIMTTVSVLNFRNKDTSILTSALSSAYVMYLCTISVISGATDTDCSSVTSGTGSARWIVVCSHLMYKHQIDKPV